MAETLKNTALNAKNNILSKAAIRFVGLICAFIGVLILFLGTNITSTVIKLLSIIIILIGILLFSGNVKKLFSKTNNKESTLYLLIGVLLIAISVLLFIFGDQISKWSNLFFGALIALYGLILLISFIIKNKDKKVWFVICLIMSLLMIASGVLIALLFKFNGNTYVTVVGIFASITGLSAMILY